MKTLQDFICSSLKDHAALVASGIPSEQALNIISQPMVTNNLNECLNQLTIDEIGKLVNLLQSGLYRFDGKKSVYMIWAIVKDNGMWKIAFTDSVLQIDSFELRTEELQERMVDDILKLIRQVL